MASIVEVNACFWCDQPHQGHARRWVMGVGFHTFVQPTDGMRKARLLARRADRTPTTRSEPS